MEDDRIANSRITASSERGINYAVDARLNYMLYSGVSGGWSAGANNLNQWIQVNLYMGVNVTGVSTQGRYRENRHSHWVTRYKVRYSNDGVDWIPVLTDNHTEVSCGVKIEVVVSRSLLV